jgi:hypothetical protein
MEREDGQHRRWWVLVVLGVPIFVVWVAGLVVIFGGYVHY